MSSKKHKKHKRYIDDLYASKSEGTGFYSGDGTSHRNKNDVTIRKSHIIIGVAVLLLVFGAIFFLAVWGQKIDKYQPSINSSSTESVASVATETAQVTDSSPWFSIDSEGTLYFHSESFTDTHLVVPKWLDGKTVTALDGESFSQENNTVTNVTLHEGVKKIGSGAFSEFTALKTVNFPATLERVGAGAFKNTPFFKESSEEFLTVGYGVLIKYNGSADSITVPDGVKAIDCGTFAEIDAQKIVTPDTVEYIGSKAFAGCKAEEIVISKALSFCESDAFDNSLWLDGKTEDFVVVGLGVLLKCNRSDTTLRLPEDVYMVSSLKPAGLGQNVTLVLGKNIRTVADLKELGRVKAFKVEKGNGSLMAKSGVLYSADGSTLYRYPIYKEDSKFYVSQSILKIGHHAFAEATLSEIELYDGLTTVGERAFADCQKLKAVTLPDTVTSLGTYAFAGCKALERATVSESVKALPRGSFSGCKALSSVTLSEGTVKIAPYSFAGCSSLKSFYVGAKVTNISPLAFDNSDVNFTITEKNQHYTLSDGKLTTADKSENAGKPIVSSKGNEETIPFS